jgi:hypothetical protein
MAFVLIIYPQREGEDDNGEESDVDYDDEAPRITINVRISVNRRIVASTVATESTGRVASRRAVTPERPGFEMKEELLRRVEDVGANKAS